MARNSAEGNKARVARYRAGLAARGIRPVQLYAPEGAHALLRQATGLMIREQDPLEPRQALRQASGANDPEEASFDLGKREWALAAEIETVRAELIAAQEAERQAGQRALEQTEAARVETRRAETAEGEVAAVKEREAAALTRADSAERAREAAEAAAAQTRAEIRQFQEAPGLRGRVIRWLAR